MIRFLQFCNEHGITLPIYSTQNKCSCLWENQSNESVPGNRPIDYANKDMKIVDVMVSFWESKNINSVLELGCNCGANLNHLRLLGYTNLNGIEINPTAIDEMEKLFPELDSIIYEDSIEKTLKYLPTNYYDMIFSMAVLLHIHPKNNFVFKEIVRVSNRYICTVEEENQYCNYVFPRNYKRVFENLGCKEVLAISINNIQNYSGYKLRLFKKLESDGDKKLVLIESM